MRRNLIAVCVLTGLCTAGLLAVTVFGFVRQLYAVGVIGAILTLVAVWSFAGGIFREQTYDKYERRFQVKDYHGALEVLDKASRNHLLYPIFRIVAFQLYLKAELAVDDVAAAAKYVDLLRHAGGDGWKYRTAYFVVLFNLDWGDFAAAQKEFAEFEHNCGHSDLYKEQIDELRILISKTHGEDVELLERTKHSPYPIVHRIVEKY